MKISELINLLNETKNEYGDVEVKVAEVTEGNNATDRYEIGFGLKIGDKEIETLQGYAVKTESYY